MRHIPKLWDFAKGIKPLKYNLKADSSLQGGICRNRKRLSAGSVGVVGGVYQSTLPPNSAKKPTGTANSSSLDGVHGSKCKRWTEPLCENRYLHGVYDPKCKQWILRMEEIERKEDIELEEWLEKIKGD